MVDTKVTIKTQIEASHSKAEKLLAITEESDVRVGKITNAI